MIGLRMKLKGLSLRELKSIEGKLKKEIAHTEESLVTDRNQLMELRNSIGQVRTRRRQLEYKEKLREEFVNLQIS